MLSPEPLWSELAVLTAPADGGGRYIVFEGPLVFAVERAAGIDYGALEGLVIGMPDRARPPFTYFGQDLLDLIAIQQKLEAGSIAPRRSRAKRR